jgi:DNA-binding transcriptional MerR regulator
MEEKNDLYFVPINEVAKRLDLPAHTLRYWEKQFGGLIKPTTGAAGRRYYRPEVVEKIATIKTLLYDRGMTIAGVKRMMHNGEFSDVQILAPIAPETPTATAPKIDPDELSTVIDLLSEAADLL